MLVRDAAADAVVIDTIIKLACSKKHGTLVRDRDNGNCEGKASKQ